MIRLGVFFMAAALPTRYLTVCLNPTADFAR